MMMKGQQSPPCETFHHQSLWCISFCQTNITTWEAYLIANRAASIPLLAYLLWLHEVVERHT